VTTGTKLWTQYVWRAQPSDWPGVNPGVYYNMPYVGTLDASHFMISAFISSGEGRRRNRRGTNTQVMAIAEATDTALTVGTQGMQYGSYQSHTAMCTTQFGAGS